MKTLHWIIGIVVIVVIVWAFLAMQDSTSEQTRDTGSTETGVLDDAADVVDSEDADTEAPAETTALEAIAPYSGFGSAMRQFDGTTFRHTVIATIDDPAPGKFYEGWLVMKTASGPNFFSTGKMERSGDKYVLSYSDSQDYPEHNDVVITEETESQGLDNNPEAHVLEGTFGL